MACLTSSRSIKNIRHAWLLSLALAAVAPAQEQQAAPLDTVSLTEVQRASLTRMREWLAAVNTGDSAIVSYLKANAVRKPFPGPPGAEPRTHEEIAIMVSFGRHRFSGGLDLVRLTTGPEGAVVGVVRNRITGDEEVVAVNVEPQPPHQIISIRGGYDAKTMATFGLKRAVSVAVTEQERLEEIGSYLNRMGDAGTFSGAVVIARDGQPVFAQAYGYADYEKKIPNTLDTPFLLASVNKLFTGLAIGQLVEQGKLGYDDPLAKFLPDFPDAESARKIRIKHLLSHTSGIAPGFGNKMGESVDADALDRQTTVKAMVDGFERKPLEFEPGTKWSYSNDGFQLLGRIIEIVTGQDYYEYMQKNVFAPAGATSASFPLLPRNGVAVVPMALPYEREFDFKALRGRVTNQLGKDFRRGRPSCCSIVSALDLIKLSNAMKAGRIVKPETFRLHSSPKPELGSPEYGYGFLASPSFLPLVGHHGNALGQCTRFGDLSGTPYTIVILSNVQIGGCLPVSARILRVLRPSQAPGS